MLADMVEARGRVNRTNTILVQTERHGADIPDPEPEVVPDPEPEVDPELIDE